MHELTDKTLLKTGAYMAGHWIDSDDNTRFDVDNPATGTVIAQVARCGAAETRRAVAAAGTALDSWRKRPALERADLLMAWYAQVMDNLGDLARMLTAEQGKPLAEAAGEIKYGAAYIRWFAEEARRIYGDTIPAPSSDKRIVCIKQPVGVVACITPWNFPNAMLTRKIAPALAAGCTVVCKPATATPLSALALAELADRAGIPAGVINVLAGSTRKIGNELTANPMVRKLTFTGSTRVGAKLIQACASTVKRTSMELGGNAPFIVFDDADLDAAVAGAVASKYRNAGQTCVCSNRLLVQSGVYDAFVEKLVAAVQEMKMGPGTQAGVTIGPMITDTAVNDVAAMVADAIEKGAVSVLGGRRSDLGNHFFEPTILTHVTSRTCGCAKRRSSGLWPRFLNLTPRPRPWPWPMIRSSDWPDTFYARDIGRIWRVAEGLEYGIVGINEGYHFQRSRPLWRHQGLRQRSGRLQIRD